ncbi:MAG: glutamyl-tRNA reductase [Ignavibacteriales bacterium]|jgi:glutamyl-tRNA reductase|nr:MAG: glutamyl-tRNA reductase [Ignavibacteriaceae bacterium]MBW7871985.1 glutamyl-tRNA reductase [Ignavibacteria bacterium]MCZ2144357.1 glutamyl-tRNA reductase [Ignavibacteriales bacterium]OQY76342.1 MAG: glutamyl-tRNA reductase [Ignavibacteriales bacterium UTCHB3]MBV6446119.1 Glutamyl-tRNA reductase [Ignavibacteriaceae bacterium]
MNLIGTSINHHTATIEQREALHLSKNETTEFLSLIRDEYFSDGFVISTCNRTEIFGIPKNPDLNIRSVQEALLNFKKIEGLTRDNFLSFFSCGAVKHILSVISGIDSLILGDSQIHGQMKEAFQLSIDLNFAGTIMRRIFDTALKAGKRSITETGIGEGAVSVSYAAIQVVEKIFSAFENRSALVIGAGETGELAAVHLKDKGIGKITIANRTLAKAEELAHKLHGEILHFDNLKGNLHNFDIIVTATSAPGFIINYDDVKNIVKKRRGNTVCIMDLALPRDVDPRADNFDGVFYHDIDSLGSIIDQNIKKREKAIPVVEEIILEEMQGLFSWYNTLEVVPTIKKIRDFFEEIRLEEVEKIRHKVHEEDLKKLDEMTKRLVGRILHNPTIRLRQIAESGLNYQEVANYTSVITSLFEPQTEDEHIENK